MLSSRRLRVRATDVFRFPTLWASDRTNSPDPRKRSKSGSSARYPQPPRFGRLDGGCNLHKICSLLLSVHSVGESHPRSGRQQVVSQADASDIVVLTQSARSTDQERADRLKARRGGEWGRLRHMLRLSCLEDRNEHETTLVCVRMRGAYVEDT